MNVADIFQAKARHLFWQRFRGDHVLGGSAEAAIDADQAYFVIRIAEMYLNHTRTLWRKFYPLLHGYIEHAGQAEHAVAGPAQLPDIGSTNLDRLINLNYRLAGPLPFRGGDVSVYIGLFSVPGQDVTKTLLDTLGTIAGLAGAGLGQAVPLANAVKAGVEGLIGLDSCALQLAVRDTFFQNNPLRSGFYVGINAAVGDVAVDQLWIRQGRLLVGADPIAARPYEDHDYMLLEVERRDRREDWPRLPGLAEFQERFAAVMRDAGRTPREKRQHLASLWPAFTQALHDSAYLVQPDRDHIAVDVSTDLNARLQALETNNPFETRAWGQAAVVTRRPEDFDLAEVPEYFDRASPSAAARAREALQGNPFG